MILILIHLLIHFHFYIQLSYYTRNESLNWSLSRSSMKKVNPIFNSDLTPFIGAIDYKDDMDLRTNHL